MKRVLIVEESTGLRQLLLEMLPRLFPDWETVGAESLDEAERHFRTELFALAILDVDFGGVGGGLELLRAWSGSDRRCPVVATTLSHALLPEIWALDPAEVLLKPWDVPEIRARLARAMATGGKGQSSEPFALTRVDGVAVQPQFTFAGAVVTPDLQCRFPNGQRLNLGAKEYGILACFAHATQTLVPREQLLRAVWGNDANSASNSVNVYLSRLRKLFAENGGHFDRCVATEAKVGWRIKRD